MESFPLIVDQSIIYLICFEKRAQLGTRHHPILSIYLSLHIHHSYGRRNQLMSQIDIQGEHKKLQANPQLS